MLQVRDINDGTVHQRKPAEYAPHPLPPPPLEAARPAPAPLPAYVPPPPPPPAPIEYLDPDIPRSAYSAGADVLLSSLVHVQKREMDAMNQALREARCRKDCRFMHQVCASWGPRRRGREQGSAGCRCRCRQVRRVQDVGAGSRGVQGVGAESLEGWTLDSTS